MLSIKVDNLRQHTVYVHDGGELSLGRQPSGSGASVVIDDDYVSRRQLRVLDVAPESVKFENLGGNPLQTADGRRIGHGEVAALDLPASLNIGHTTIRFEWTRSKHDAMQDTVPGMPQLRLGTTVLQPPPEQPRGKLASLGETPSPERLIYWFETLLLVQQAAVGSAEFYRETAEAIVKLVGLDRGLVLLKQGDDWEVVAAAAASDHKSVEYSVSILEKVVEGKQTVYGNPQEMSSRNSLLSLEAVVGAPIFDQNHEVIGMVYGSRDLKHGLPSYSISSLEAHVVQLLACSVIAGHHRQQIEEQLKQKEKLAAVGQALGYILHDLRGPLGNARQLADMLRANDTSALSRDEQLDYIEDSISVAGDLLNDSLEFCRGKIQVSPVRGRFKDLFAKHLRLLQLSLEGSHATLKIEAPDSLELVVDPDRMARVIRNLAKNAAEACHEQPNATVTIGASKDAQYTRLWVADNGPGMPAEVQEHLFQPFATHGKHGGTGFGLAIAKQLVDAHQGTIQVESSDQGTRFVIALPNNLPAVSVQQTSTPALPSTPPNTGGLHVLVAEDMLVNQRLLQGLLDKLGHEAVIASDGTQAVSLWKTESFDVILMDIEMPRLDGLAACREIRAAERTTGQRTPIFGLSGHETPEVHQQCQAAGMDGYVAKPIRLERLEKLLSGVPGLRSP